MTDIRALRLALNAAIGASFRNNLEDVKIPAGFAMQLDDALREKEPQVLTVEEVKRIGTNNHDFFKNDGPTVVWLEEFGKQLPPHVMVPEWDEDDWRDEPNNIVNAHYFGTGEFDQFSLTDYNKTWRCWADKPTETQRMGVAWYA